MGLWKSLHRSWQAWRKTSVYAACACKMPAKPDADWCLLRGASCCAVRSLNEADMDALSCLNRGTEFDAHSLAAYIKSTPLEFAATLFYHDFLRFCKACARDLPKSPIHYL